MAERVAPSSVTASIRAGSMLVIGTLFVFLVYLSGPRSSLSLRASLQRHAFPQKLDLMKLNSVTGEESEPKNPNLTWPDDAASSMMMLDAEPLVVGRHSNKAQSDWVDKHKDIDDIVARAAAKSVAKKQSDPYAKNNLDEIVARATYRSVAKFQDEDAVQDVDENELKYAAQLAAKSVAVNVNRLANYVDVPKTELASAIGSTTTIAVGKNAPGETEAERAQREKEETLAALKGSTGSDPSETSEAADGGYYYDYGSDYAYYTYYTYGSTASYGS